MLPTAAAYEHPERAVDTARAWFGKFGATVRELMILSRRDAQDEAAAEQLRAAWLPGQQVLAALDAWWDTKADKTGRMIVQTYYGPQLLHELMERTTWHCGQHVRQ